MSLKYNYGIHLLFFSCLQVAFEKSRLYMFSAFSRIKHFLIAFSSTFSSVQFSSVAQSCPTLCDPMNRSTPGLPVHHQLPEFTQTHVHRVSDAIQPSHPLSAPSPPALANSFSFPWACPLWPKERGVCVFRDSIWFLTHTAPRRLGDTRLWREVSSPAGQNPHGYSKRCSPCGALPTPAPSM